jgi:hypothetical protein
VKRFMGNTPSPVTWKQLSTILLSLAAVLGAFSAVHAQVVVPNILMKANDLIDKRLEAHNTRPHLGAVTHAEFDQLRTDIRELGKKIDAIAR